MALSRHPTPSSRAGRIIAGIIGGLISVAVARAAWQHVGWQNDVLELMEMPPIEDRGMARRLGGRRGRLGPRAEGWDADGIEDLATELEKDSSPARPGPFGATSILLDNGGVHQAPGRMLEG